MQRARRPALARAVSVRIAAKGGPNCDRPNRKWLIHIAGLLYATLTVPTDERICRELAHRGDHLHLVFQPVSGLQNVAEEGAA